MNTELQAQDQEVLEQKKQAWGQMGVAVHQTEMQLQVEAQSYLTSLAVLPTTIEEIPGAEDKLSAAKKGLTAITNKRKEVTSKFDAVAARLMAPEKSFVDPIKVYSDAIIKLKKEDEANKAKLRNIDEEKNRCREFFQNKKIEVESGLNEKLIGMVSRCYEHALNENITMENLSMYLDKCADSVTVKSFPIDTPVFVNYHISADEVVSIRQQTFIIDQSSYPSLFGKMIESKFSDYEVAIGKKAAALALSQKQDQEKQAEIKQEAQQQTMANKIESAAFVPNVAPSETKALKHGYIVDMPETVESVLMIMAAFSANIQLCLKYLKVTKWFSFTAQQAATALGKVKCEDNSFQPSGIIFKQIDKL